MTNQEVDFHYRHARHVMSQIQQGLEMEAERYLRAASSLLSLAREVDGSEYENELHDGVRLLNGLAVGDYAPTVTVRVRATRIVITLNNVKALLNNRPVQEDPP